VDHSLVDREWREEILDLRTDWVAAESSAVAPRVPLPDNESLTDPDFFVESWTLGAAAAAQNFRHRHQASQREPLASFRAPLPFTPSAEWLQAATVPLPHEFFHSIQIGQGADGAIGAATVPVTMERARVLLGVNSASTQQQIKSAYHQMASRYHPDRCLVQNDEQRRLATERMSVINEAYRLLCP